MISGRRALAGLSLELADARSRFDELAPGVREMARAHARLLGEERGLFAELARLYLPGVSPETVVAGLEGLRTELERALVLQAGHAAELARELGKAEAALASLVERVRLEDEEEERLAGTLAERSASVESTLAADPGYLRTHQDHEAVLAHQDLLRRRRAGLAELARLERRRYQAFRPFTYLLQRGWDTPEYHASPLGRRLDRWLARKVGFDALRRSWSILRDGPRVIGVEIGRVRERAAELERRIDEREDDEARKQGLIEALRACADAGKRSAGSREELLRLRSRRDRLVTELHAVEARRGAAYESVIDRHDDLLGSPPLEGLLEKARSSADPRGDEQVSRLDALGERLASSERALEGARRELQRLASAIGRIAEVERTASTRYTDQRSRFPDDFQLDRVLAQLISGQTEPRDVIDGLARAHSKGPLLVAVHEPLHGWFGELSRAFDGGAGVEVVAEGEGEEVDHLVVDAHGRVFERRVTRRGQTA